MGTEGDKKGPELDADFMVKFNLLFEKVGKIEERTQDMAKIKDLCSGLENKLENLGKEIKMVKERSQKNEQDINSILDDIAYERNMRRQLELYGRKPNIIVRGIPVMKDESVRDLLKTLAAKLEVGLEEYHICATHRLPSRGEVPPIIVRLNDYDKKDELMKAVKEKKIGSGDLEMTGDTPIFIDEQLTEEARALLSETKKLSKAGKFEAAWYRGGEVWIREYEKGPRLRIDHPQQLIKYHQMEVDTEYCKPINETPKRHRESPDVDGGADGQPSQSNNQHRFKKVVGGKAGSPNPPRQMCNQSTLHRFTSWRATSHSCEASQPRK